MSRVSLGYRLLDPNDSVRRSTGRRIGILGGSFNPPHKGHVHLTEVALQRLALDEVWWLLSPQNPLKSEQAPAIDARLAACEQLVRDPRIKLTTLEEQLKSNLTVVTLSKLLRLFPDRQFTWLMGADNLASFHHWNGWRDIAAMLPIAVIDRPDYGIAALHAPMAQKLAGDRRYTRHFSRGWRFIDGPQNPLSSTALRKAARASN